MTKNEINKRGPAFPRLRPIGTKKPPKQSVPRPRASWQERFNSKVDKHGPIHQVLRTRCHLWTGSKGVSGHGQFKHEGKVQGAHRMAFLMAYGRWPVPHALHHCDNLLCVNPEHLFEGHVRKDVSERNHLTTPLAPRAEVLTPKQIDHLRKQFNGRNLKQLAKAFGITNSYATELVYTTTPLSRQETSVVVRA